MLFRSLGNGIYQLRNYDLLEEYQVYCHMTEISGCGSGGWTLVMKIDGNKVKIKDIKCISRYFLSGINTAHINK